MIFRHTIINQFLLSVSKSPIIAHRHLEQKATIGPPLDQPLQAEFWLASLCWANVGMVNYATDGNIFEGLVSH